MKKEIVTIAFILPLWFVLANAQTVSVANDPVSLRQILAKQPDYTATQQFHFSEGFGGFSAKSRVAKLGSRQVEIKADTIFISEPGKPTIKVFPKRKEYTEIPEEKIDYLAITPEGLAKSNDVVFKSLGKEKVGKYTCIKIEVSYKDEKLRGMKFLFWAAPELKNLVIRSEASLGDKVKLITSLEDIILSVNEDYFRIPAGYKKVVESN